MVLVDCDGEDGFEDERFAAATAFESERAKVICGHFEPGQFIPVHAPDSDVVVHVREGRGLVHDDGVDREVGPGDTVVVPAGHARGVHANRGERLVALLVTAPPPTDEEHEPVRKGLRAGEFRPTE